MLSVGIYYLLLLPAAAYAFLRGGGPEKVGAAILVLGSVLSTIAFSAPAVRYGSIEVGVFLVDVAALVALICLALRAERLWTLWLTSLHILGTAAHAVKMVDPGLIPMGYAFALAFWSYLMLLILVLGTRAHQKRVARFGADRSWSSSSSPSVKGPPDGPSDWWPSSGRSPGPWPPGRGRRPGS